MRDGAIVEADGSVDEKNMTGAGGQSDSIRITTGVYVHLPVDARSDVIGARIEQGNTSRCNPPCGSPPEIVEGFLSRLRLRLLFPDLVVDG